MSVLVDTPVSMGGKREGVGKGTEVQPWLMPWCHASAMHSCLQTHVGH